MRNAILESGLIVLFCSACGSDGFSSKTSADIDVTPSTALLFKRVPQNQSDYQTVEVRQSGSADLIVKNIYIESSYDAASGKDACSMPMLGLQESDPLPDGCEFIITKHPQLPYTLGEDAFFDIDLRYRPLSSTAPASTYLVIESNAIDDPVKKIELSVQAAAAQLSVSQTAISFYDKFIAAEPNRTGRSMLVVKNAGTAPLTVSELKTRYRTPVVGEGEFTIQKDHELPWNLKEGETEYVTVIYEPQDDLHDVMELSFVSNGGSAGKTLVTSGPAYPMLSVRAESDISDRVVVFKPNENGDLFPKVVTFFNPGDLPVNLLSMKFEKGVYSLGSQQTSFSLLPKATREVTLTPAQGSASQDDVLIITSNAKNADEQNASSPDQNVSHIHLTRDATSLSGVLVVDQAVLDFGEALQGQSKTLTVKIANVGGESVTLDAIALSDESSDAFSVAYDGALELPAKGELPVAVTLTRAAEDGNAYFGSLQIQAGETKLTVPLSAVLP